MLSCWTRSLSGWCRKCSECLECFWRFKFHLQDILLHSLLAPTKFQSTMSIVPTLYSFIESLFFYGIYAVYTKRILDIYYIDKILSHSRWKTLSEMFSTMCNSRLVSVIVRWNIYPAEKSCWRGKWSTQNRLHRVLRWAEPQSGLETAIIGRNQEIMTSWKGRMHICCSVSAE